MERKLIAINGTIGSGKDTFAKVFIEEGYHRLSFAETLKDAASSIFGWDREMLEGSTEEFRKVREMRDDYWSSKIGKDITPRWVLQNLGTDILRRHFHDNIWVFSLEKKILDLENKNIIITDCRFSNEIQMIRNNNGIIIEVQRIIPNWYYDAFQYNLKKEEMLNTTTEFIENIKKPLSLENIHSSEYGWIGINRPDFIVENNSTVHSVREQAYSIMSKISQ